MAGFVNVAQLSSPHPIDRSGISLPRYFNLRLKFFVDDDVRPYAILSHRWDEEEVSFANLRDCMMVEDGLSQSAEDDDKIFPAFAELRELRMRRLQSMKGWTKFSRFCEKSLEYGFEWAWIDAACIDKSSSAELQEAINSMFRWYQDASICFVYMNDVTVDSVMSPNNCESQFRQSSWFTRGWTLQELLAPACGTITFFNRNWDRIGLDTDLIESINLITGIPRNILSADSTSVRLGQILICSVAQRMSWAANRQVTRKEDMAYSLLGLFDIAMPLLYGEGADKAFERLQLEIVKVSPDESIFAWNPSISWGEDQYKQGYLEHPSMLAASPREFAGLGRLFNYSGASQGKRGDPHQMTSRGLLIHAVVIDRRSETVPAVLKSEETWRTNCVMPLLCGEDTFLLMDDRRTVIIQLHHIGENTYLRNGPNFVVHLNWSQVLQDHQPKSIFIRESFKFGKG